MRLFSKKEAQRGKGWIETFVKQRASELALVRGSVSHDDFLQYCIDGLPVRKSGRDTRKQAVVRTIRRMHDRGDLPFKVDGELFVFD